MIKTIHLNESQSVELKGSMGWFFIYRAQFGRDILITLMPLIDAVFKMVKQAMGITDAKEAIEAVKEMDSDEFEEMLVTAATFEFTSVLEIVWALAKNADDTIPEPEEWVDQFETFPIDVVIPEVFKLILETSISTKNSKRLLKIMKTKKQ